MQLVMITGIAAVILVVAIALIVGIVNRPRQERADFKAESLRRILERHERDRFDE